MKHYTKTETTRDFMLSLETIHCLNCTECGDRVEFEGTKTQACNEFYAQGWRITELDTLCIRCFKYILDI